MGNGASPGSDMNTDANDTCLNLPETGGGDCPPEPVLSVGLVGVGGQERETGRGPNQAATGVRAPRLYSAANHKSQNTVIKWLAANQRTASNV